MFLTNLECVNEITFWFFSCMFGDSFDLRILYQTMLQEETSQGWEERKRSGGFEIGTIAWLSLQRKSMWLWSRPRCVWCRFMFYSCSPRFIFSIACPKRIPNENFSEVTIGAQNGLSYFSLVCDVNFLISLGSNAADGTKYCWTYEKQFSFDVTAPGARQSMITASWGQDPVGPFDVTWWEAWTVSGMTRYATKICIPRLRAATFCSERQKDEDSEAEPEAAALFKQQQKLCTIIIRSQPCRQQFLMKKFYANPFLDRKHFYNY